MKIMIEVSGGVVTNIVSTGEVSIYLVDHDELKERGGKAKLQAFQPDYITWEDTTDPPPFDETPEFDTALKATLSEYQEGDTGLFCGVIPYKQYEPMDDPKYIKKAQQWENSIDCEILDHDQPHEREEAGTDGSYNV